MSREHLDAAALARIVAGGQKEPGREHLAGCAQCRDEAEALQSDLGALSRRARESAPHTASSFTWPQTARARRAKPRGWLWSPALGAAALALILAVAWLGIRAERPAQLAFSLEQPRPRAGIMDDEPERLGGFAGFLVAENSAESAMDFMNDDDDIASGAEGVILWPGV